MEIGASLRPDLCGVNTAPVDLLVYGGANPYSLRVGSTPLASAGEEFHGGSRSVPETRAYRPWPCMPATAVKSHFSLAASAPVGAKSGSRKPGGIRGITNLPGARLRSKDPANECRSVNPMPLLLIILGVTHECSWAKFEAHRRPLSDLNATVMPSKEEKTAI